MFASTVVFGIFYSYMILRVRKFSPRLNGIGDYRRNILTFMELARVLIAILLFFFFESILVFALYNVQDHIGTDGVFIVYYAYSFFFETILGILLVWVTAYKSLANFTDLWCNSEPQNLSFFITPHLLEPRREELYIVSDNTSAARLKVPGIEMEDGRTPTRQSWQVHEVFLFFTTFPLFFANPISFFSKPYLIRQCKKRVLSKFVIL